jgi:FMN phosphatase YigB (HAD superfamily)
MKDGIAVILIVDGDNTLWDTNVIFENAQLNMLRNLNKENLNIDPETEISRLREFDDVLVRHYNKHEYDFSVLALSLYSFYKGLERDEAIRRACEAFEKKLDIERMDFAIKCGNKFKEELRKFPPLFKDAKETLETLKQHDCVIILSSEGDKERVRRILRYYSMESYFDHVLNGRKSVEQFKEARKIGIQIWRMKHLEDKKIPKIMVVGDLLDRDIQFGNLIGAITVYKPGGYKGHQTPRNENEKPNYQIKEMHEVIDILSFSKG